jgi:hypothetical protein
MHTAWPRQRWHKYAILLTALTIFVFAAQQRAEVRAEPEDAALQQPLPAGVVRLSLARLHARTLALHHNELQARGRRKVFVYPPDVYSDGVRVRGWVSEAPGEGVLTDAAVEMAALRDAILLETRLAAGVEYDRESDVRVELHAPERDRPWVLDGQKWREMKEPEGE